ncbi:MAG: hypothetical protein LBI75_00465 [Brucellaceae bacterium]|jgi:hypothetical protein|nr:hypothetical protein [Brucellaceae bacterium]
MKFLIRIYPDVVALICGLLVLPWILGVPGQPTQAALSGWTIGLIGIVVYLILYQVVKSLMKSDLCKRNDTLHQTMRIILNSASLCIVPVLLFSFLLLFRF